MTFLSSIRLTPAQIVLSEVMGDPSSVTDAHGEFLELANAGVEAVHTDSLIVAVNGDSLTLPGFNLAPGVFYLLCKDSTRSTNGGMACDGIWPGLNIVNTKSCSLSVAYAAGNTQYVLPAPKPGVSWENTFESGESFRRFLPSDLPWSDKDSATPGFRNGRSLQPAHRDLGITAVTWEPGGGAGFLRVGLEDRSLTPATEEGITARLDGDWDGVAETLLDSVILTAGEIASGSCRVPLSAEIRGLISVQLGRDENPANDAYPFFRWEGKSLEITEACPAPLRDGPEWLEIRNRADRALNLSRVACNGVLMGDSTGGPLEPGEYLIVTGDEAGFRARFGALKVRVLELANWKTLRNTGDTLRLSLAGQPLDTLIYTGKAAEAGNGCLVRAQNALLPEPAFDTALASVGSPGYELAMDSTFSWILSGKVINPGGEWSVVVNVPPPTRYAMKAFDLEGNCVRDFGGGLSGRHTLRWSGEGKGGRILPPGPYVLCLIIQGHRIRKKVVVVAGAQ